MFQIATALAIDVTAVGERWTAQRWTVEDGLPLDHVNGIEVDRHGHLWLATMDGLHRFDGARFESVGVGGPRGVPSPRVLDVVRAPGDDALWVTFVDGRLQRRTAENVAILPPLGPGMPHLVRDGDAMWATAGSTSLFTFDPEPRVAQTGIEVMGLAVHEGRRWGFLIGTGEWVALDAEHQVDASVPPRIEALRPGEWGGWSVVESGLVHEDGSRLDLDSAVNDLCVAGPDEIWVATRGSGIIRVRPRTLQVVEGPFEAHPRVERLAWDEGSGQVWARADESRWWNASGDASPVSPPALLDLPREPGQRLGSLPLALPGLSTWAAAGRVWTLDDAAPTPVPSGPRFWLALESHVTPDSVWLGAVDGLFRWKNGRWDEITDRGETIDSARAFATLPDGSIVVAASGKLRWIRDDDVLRRSGWEVPTVRHARVWNDRLWMASEELGLCAVLLERVPDLFEGSAPFPCLGEREGLGTYGVHATATDAMGRTWLTANRGIGWIETAQLEDALATGASAPVIWLGRRDGMVSAEANGAVGGALVTDESGVLWVPTQHGVVRVDPRDVPISEPPAVALATPSVTGGTAIADGLELDGPESEVTLRWRAASFDHREQLRFRYRIDADARWTTQTEDRVRLERLPAGATVFEVQAGLGGRWGPPARLHIQRRPTLLERPLTWVFLALALIGMTAAAGWWRLRQARFRERELESRIDAATVQLRDAAEENRTLYERAAVTARHLEELDLAKRRLLANVSHELRTPLTLVMGPLDSLRQRIEAGESRDLVDLAFRNAERLRTQIAQLLQVAHAQSGTLKLRVRPNRIGLLVRRVLDRFSRSDGELRCVPPPEDVQLWCDPEMFETMLGNLVGNAFEHGEPPVEVHVELDDDRVRIVVRDYGKGPGDDPERPSAGMGLGLMLVRELVQLHGGALGHMHAGHTAFWLDFPRGVDAFDLDDLDVREVPIETFELPSEPGGHRVLLVEDNGELRSFLSAHLAARFEIAAVATAEEAAQHLEAHPVDLLVSDVMLPGRSGLDLAEWVRSSDRSAMPILLISARGSTDDKVEGLAIADGYLAKPFRVRELIARCEALLRRSSPAPDTPEPELPDAASTFLTKLEAYADSHLDDPQLDVDRLAQSVAVSRRNLHDRLRAMGLPAPKTWLRERRLDHAEKLLTQGVFDTVGEVAAAVGMSRAYFSRAYKARTGVSPKEALDRSRPA